jgi:hypothetical protein
VALLRLMKSSGSGEAGSAQREAQIWIGVLVHPMIGKFQMSGGIPQ